MTQRHGDDVASDGHKNGCTATGGGTRTEARTARAVLASGRAASRTSATALVADVDDCMASCRSLMMCSVGSGWLRWSPPKQLQVQCSRLQ